MSEIKEIINFNFPAIDNDIYNYIFNILEDGKNDFQNREDIFECLGEVFINVTEGIKNKDEIKDICQQLLQSLKKSDLNEIASNEEQRILSKPVHLGEMASNMSSYLDKYKSIWCSSKEVSSQVDSKRLEKAEAKLKLKQEKRDFQESSNRFKLCINKSASTNQMINKRNTKLEEISRNMDIKIENFDISFGNKCLLKNATINLSYGRRYGLIGRNGIGKSTLLKMITNGSLLIPKHIQVLHVEQEIVGDDTSALEAVLQCDKIRSKLLEEEKKLLNSKIDDDNSRLEQIYRELTVIEADKAPSRAALILRGLGFDEMMQKQATKKFSGGWRMKIALARALFSKPDLLLLDEPTNMLDIKANIWLEDYLSNSWSTTLLIVSHNRHFLNRVPTNIFHFHNQKIDTYSGNYDSFVKAKIEKLKNQQREYDAQMELRKHTQKFIDKFRYNTKRASLVQSKIKMLHRLPKLTPVEKEDKVLLKFPNIKPLLGACILQLDEVSFGFDFEDILYKVNVDANLNSRICIVGDNGSGKTTLLKLLIGDFLPRSGERKAHRNLKIGYFSQHHVDQLTMDQSALEFIATKFPGNSTNQYLNYLSKFGISSDLSLQPIHSLSGGQKSRLAFAIMSFLNPQLIILDEPTNHLDIETVESLGEALNKYNGGVILVSHDEGLIKVVCKELWLVKNKAVKRLKGGFDEYRKMIESELESVK